MISLYEVQIRDVTRHGCYTTIERTTRAHKACIFAMRVVLHCARGFRVRVLDIVNNQVIYSQHGEGSEAR